MTESEKKPTGGSPPVYPTFRSETLFAQGKVIVIVHAGRSYQLRITSANKLILTA